MKFHLPSRLFKALLAAVCVPGITLTGNAYTQSTHYVVYAAAEAPATLQWDSTGTEPAVWDTEQPDVWTDTNGNETSYREGADVLFSDGADLNKSVQITPEGITAESVEINGSGYSFAGGNMAVTEQIKTADTVTMENALIMGSTTVPLTIDVANGANLTVAYLGTTFSESNGTHMHAQGSFTKVGGGTLSVTDDVHGFITCATILDGSMELGEGVTMDIGANEILGGTLENVQMFITGDITRTLTNVTTTSHNVIKSANGTHAALLTDVSLNAGTAAEYATLQNVVFAGESTLTGYITFESTHAQREMGVATGSTLNVNNVTFELRGIASGSKVLIVNGAVSDASNGLLSGIAMPGNVSGLEGTLTGWETVKFVYSGVAVNKAAVDSSVAGMVTLIDKHNGNLYWDGAENGTWDAVTGNWSLTEGESGDAVFTALSNIYFGGGDVANKDVSVLQDSVVMNFNVSEGGYTFSGSRIAVLNDALMSPDSGSVTFNNQLVVQGNLVTDGAGNLELKGATTVGKNAQIGTLNTSVGKDLTVGGNLTINAGNSTEAGSLTIDGNVTAENMNIAVSAGDKDGNSYDNALVNVSGNLTVAEGGSIIIGGTAEQHYLGVVKAPELTVNTLEHEVYFDHIHTDLLTVGKGAYVHVQTATSAVSVSASSFPEINLHGTLALDAEGATYNNGYNVHVMDDAAQLRFGTGCTIDNLKIFGAQDADGYTDLDIMVQSRSATVTQMQDLGNLTVNIGTMTVKNATGSVHGTLTLNNGKLQLHESADHLMAANSGAINLRTGSRWDIGTTTQAISAGNAISLSGASAITGNKEAAGLQMANGVKVSYAEADNAISANMVVNDTITLQSAQEGSSLNITGAVSGKGMMELTGHGTVAFSGQNDFSGMLLVEQGATLSLQSADTLANAGVFLGNGATLALDAESAVNLNSLVLMDGASLAITAINGTDSASAQDAALHITPSNGNISGGHVMLNVLFDNKIDTMTTYNLMTGLASADNLSLNVLHNGAALDSSQYKVGYDAQSGLLYMQTFMGNVWEGESAFAMYYGYGIWSQTNSQGNWSHASNYNENAEYNDAIFSDLDGGCSTVYIEGTVNPGDVYFVADHTDYTLGSMGGKLAAGTNLHQRGESDVILRLYDNVYAADALGDVDIKSGSITLEDHLAVAGDITIAAEGALVLSEYGTVDANWRPIPVELRIGPKEDGTFAYTISNVKFSDDSLNVKLGEGTLSGVTIDEDGVRGTAETPGYVTQVQISGNADLKHLEIMNSDIIGATLTDVTLKSGNADSDKLKGYYRMRDVTIGENVVVAENARYSFVEDITFRDTLINRGVITITNINAEIGQIDYSFTVDENGKSEYTYQFIKMEGAGRFDMYSYKTFETRQVLINGVNLATGLAAGIGTEFVDNKDGSFTLSIGNVTEYDADGNPVKVNGTVGMPQWDERWGKMDKAPGLSRRYAGTDPNAEVVIAAGTNGDADYFMYDSIVNDQNAQKVNNGKALSVTLSSVACGQIASGGAWGAAAYDHEVWIYDRSGIKTVIGGMSNWVDNPQAAATHILVNSVYDGDGDGVTDVKDLVIAGSRWCDQNSESFLTIKDGNITEVHGGSYGWVTQRGTAHVYIDGGTIGEVFAAGYDSNLIGTQVVDGRTRAVEMVLTGGTLGMATNEFTKRVFGGGHGLTIEGDIYIRMEGDANVQSQLVGGSNGGTVNGNIVLDLISGTANRVDAAGMGWGNEWSATNSFTNGDVQVNLYRDFHLGSPINVNGNTDWVGGKLYGGRELTESYIVIGDAYTSTLHFAEAGTYELGRIVDGGYTASANSVTVTGFDKITMADGAHAIVALGMFDNDMDTATTLQISGKGVVEVIGHGENFGRDITLTDGATLKVSTSVIGTPNDRGDDRTITVTDGSTIDFSGFPVESGYKVKNADDLYAGLGFNVKISGNGADGMGAIYKGTYTGDFYPSDEIGNKNIVNKVCLPSVELTGSASARVTNGEYLYMNSYALGKTLLDLNGHTFTKLGKGSLTTRTVTMTEGTVLVQEGMLGIDKESHAENTDLVLAGGSSLKLNVTEVAGDTTLGLRTLIGAGSVELNDSPLTLHTGASAKYHAEYLDDTQTYNQFSAETGFAYAVFSGTISDGNKANGVLTKAGDGVHYISGSANTYTGGTRVQEGRLYLLGSSAYDEFSKGTSTVSSGVAGTGSIVWAGADAELYLGHNARIYNSGTTNVADGVMTIGVEGAPSGTLGNFIGRHSLDTNGNLVYITMGGEEYVEIETHNLKSIAVNATYANGTAYAAGTEIDRNLMLLVKKSDWAAAQATAVTGFIDTGYNEAIYSGVLRDSNNVSAKLHKVGVGTLVMDQTNSYTGDTLISEGTLRLLGWGTAGANEKTNLINVEKDGATFMFTYTGSYGDEPTELANDINLTGTGDARWQGHAATDGDTAALISAVGPAVTFTLSGDITGNGNVRHSGEGVLVLSGDSSYTGGTYVSRGTVEVQSATGLGATADGNGSVILESDADMKVTVEEGYTEERMVTTLAADANDIQGDVIITGTAETERILHMESNGYNAASTTVNAGGTLLIHGNADGGAPISAHSGLLTGSGAVVVSDAAGTGATATFDSMIDYKGDLRVEGDKASIQAQTGSFYGGSIHVAGQQAEVSIGGNVTVVDGKSLHLSSTGSADSQTKATLSTAGRVSVASGAELYVSNQATDYAYNLNGLQQAASLDVTENGMVIDSEPVFHAIGSNTGKYDRTYDAGIALNSQAAGAIQAGGELILAGGATYTTVKANVSLMGGRLTLDTMENRLLILNATPDSNIDKITLNTQLVLFSDVGGVTFGLDNIIAESGTGIYFTRADRYFTGCDFIDEDILLVYDSNAQVVYLHHSVPEPATATLSLLALAALAARRRRR